MMIPVETLDYDIRTLATFHCCQNRTTSWTCFLQILSCRTKSTGCHKLTQQLLISWSLISLVFTFQSTASWLLIGCLPWTRPTPSCSENDDRCSVKTVLLSFHAFWPRSGADKSDLSGFCSVESRFPALTSVESFLQRDNSNYN